VDRESELERRFSSENKKRELEALNALDPPPVRNNFAHNESNRNFERVRAGGFTAPQYTQQSLVGIQGTEGESQKGPNPKTFKKGKGRG
jgi:hypothetical protein